MGILRTDRVSGLGGANAIKGSVFFGNDGSSGTAKGTSLNIVDANDKADLNFGTGNFTFEAWIYPFNNISFNCVYSQAWGLQIYSDTVNNRLKMYTNDSDDSNSYTIDQAQSASGTILPDRWNHIAVVRNGSTFTMYTNGTGASPSTGVSSAIASSSADYTIGIFNSLGVSGHDYGSYFGFAGYISNLRIRTGAQYTSNFTPPVGELQKTSNTVLLACQSPGDITKEATGKTIVPTSKNLSDALPQASHFTPNSPVGFSTTTDVGTQFGSTFDGVTTFDSQAYFVPPGGNTRERNRGRAIFAGGSRSPYKDIQVVDISSGGIAQDFGDTVSAAHVSGSASSSTRMLVTIGGSPSVVNTIEFITIADIASSTDFGDLTEPRRRTQSLSNSTRAVHVGGTSASPASLYRNEIDFNTIATAGNSTDFGDTLAAHVATGGSVASSTRGVYSVGYLSGSYVNNIEFITIATTGNGQDFGDLNAAKGYHFRGSICDSTRGLFAGGYNPAQNRIDFVTIASAGNATDFGDLFLARRSAAGTSNSTHSIFAGGYLPGVNNTIDRVVIQTTGNAADFGDLFFRTHENSGSSDSHGGLS